MGQRHPCRRISDPITKIHQQHIVGDVFDDGQVVGDEQVSNAAVLRLVGALRFAEVGVGHQGFLPHDADFLAWVGTGVGVWTIA